MKIDYLNKWHLEILEPNAMLESSYSAIDNENINN